MVVRGHKDVTLFPPCDLPWLGYRNYQQAVFKRTAEGGFKVERKPELGE